MLDYPSRKIHQAKNILSLVDGDTRRMIQEFFSFVDSTPHTSVEEIYTSTFDLQPSCYPYIGYQLFGEDYKRGSFMAKLKEVYKDYDFEYDEKELPDHISIVLSFLPHYTFEEREEFIEYCLLPSIKKMSEGLSDENPYKKVLSALLKLLNGGDNYA